MCACCRNPANGVLRLNQASSLDSASSERAAEQLAGAMDTRANRSDGQVQYLGNLLVRTLFHVREQDGRSKLLRESRQRGLKALFHLRRQDDGLRIACRIRDLHVG